MWLRACLVKTTDLNIIDIHPTDDRYSDTADNYTVGNDEKNDADTDEDDEHDEEYINLGVAPVSACFSLV